MFRDFKFIVVDIETKNLTPDQIAFETQFLKHHPSTKSDEKKKQQLEVKRLALHDKGALSDSSEIACIGVYSCGIEPLVLHTFDFTDPIPNVDHVGMSSETDMLLNLASVLNTHCDDETEIVVASSGFDLPKIRFACVRNSVPIPRIFQPRASNPVYDVLYMAGRYFMASSGAEYHLGLDELTKRLGINQSGKIIHGSEIPGMIDQGQYEEVITYCGIDVLLTGKSYMLMTGYQNNI